EGGDFHDEPTDLDTESPDPKTEQQPDNQEPDAKGAKAAAEDQPELKSNPPKTPDTPVASGSYSENIGSVDWVNMGHQLQPLPPKSKIWVGVLIVLILGAGTLYFFISSSNSTGNATEAPIKNEQPAINS